IVRDFETQEVIGYIGTIDGGQFTPGVEKGIRGVLNGNGTVYPIDKDGNVSKDLLKLKDGKYAIELRAVDSSNKEFIEQSPFIVDTNPATWEVDKPGGVYELKDEDFTIEEYEGQQQEAFWIHGKVDDESIEIFNNMGVKASKSDINVVSYLDGMIGPKFNVDEDGNYKLGIEKNDIERPNNHLELTTMPLDEATALNPDGGERYFFMKEGTPYVYSKLDKKEMVEKDEITTTLSFNNVKNASNFKTQLQYLRGFKIKDVKLNDEGVNILEEKGYEAILSHKDESSTLRPKESFNIDIKDKDGNAVEYSGDIDLVDVVFELEDDRNLSTYKGYFFCKESGIYDTNGGEQDLSTRLVYDMVDVPQNSSRGIMADPIEGTADINKKPEENLKYIWVEDNEGNKYDFEYDSSWSKYTSKDLPVSDKEYTIVTQAPGHFRREEQFIPSRNIDGKLIGKDSMIGFNIKALAGDVDGNSAIDIHDAMSLADDYGKFISNNEMKNKDFNADGKIDEKDMDYVVKNFMKINSQDKDSATPQKESDGITLDDILKQIGYK
ncbi:MAG: hypothetical protein ACRC3Y_18355, partial [Romboutsia sp.]|uniref:hypothetical protein n=1 Tax=Romboutsia sp. TaxID=1965302 RepID=UPI003F3EE96F